MTSEICWDSPGQERLLLKFSPPVSWNEFDASIKQAHAVCASNGQSVELIVLAQTPMPEGIALTHLTAAFRSQPANVRRLIIVPEQRSGMTALLIELASVIRRLFPQQGPIFFVNSLEEALRLPD